MLLPILALTAVLASPPRGEDLPREVSDSNAYIVECLVNGTALTQCKVVDGDPATDPDAATALKLAANVQVPATLAQAGWIRIKLNVNP